MSYVDRIIASFIAGLAQIIATEMLLGILFKNLYAAPLFISNILISTTVLTYSHVIGRKNNLGLDDLLIEFKDAVLDFIKILKGDWKLSCMAGLFIISVSWIILTGYLFPSYAWDALWYHLPIVGYIMQSGAIQEFPVHSFIEQFINIFPKNIELFFLWNIIFLKSDVVTDLSQMLFAVAGILGIYSLAIKLKIHKKYAVFSSFLFFYAPVIILQLTTNYVDVSISVLFLIAVNFLMSRNAESNLHSEQRTFPLFLAGITTGILLGSKGSGPLFVVVLSAVVIMQEFMNTRTSFSFIRRISASAGNYLLYFLVPFLLLGGYWYAKNWIIYDNPVYPMEISVLNITIFKGLFQGMIEPVPAVINKLNYFTRPFYVWAENIPYYLYDSRLGGLGPLWFILFLPALLFSSVYSVLKKKYDFIIVCIIIMAVFLLYPRNWTPRYVIFIVGLGALSFGLLMTYFTKWEKTLKSIALLLAAYTAITSNSPSITPEKVREFIHLPANERTIGKLAAFNLDVHARKEYGYWIWISRNVSEGDTLAYTFEPLFHSPLWSRAFSSRIVYLNSGEYTEWIQLLQENDASYILIKSNGQEDTWIGQAGNNSSSTGRQGNVRGKFQFVYTDENYKIVKYEKDAG